MRRALPFLLVLAAAATLRLTTWDPVADGERPRFIQITAAAALAAGVVYAALATQVAPRSWLPVAAGALVFLAGDALHYLRLAHPLTRGAPLVTVPLADEATLRAGWDVDAGGDGQVRFEGGALVLQSGPTGRASVTARVPRALEPGAPQPWWLPAGVVSAGRRERLAWRAAIRRTGEFYVVAEVGRLLVQSVSYGVKLSYPDSRGELQSQDLNLLGLDDGQPREWSVTRDPQRVTLSIEGRDVWTAPTRGERGAVRLGEARPDPLHGGALRIERAGYTVSLMR